MKGTQHGATRHGDHAAMMQDCQAMMARMKEAQAKLDAMVATLDKLVVEMNAATGGVKVEAMTAVINELISQRKAMRGMMIQMQPAMMVHMMGYMQTGKMQGAAASVSERPMMKKAGQQGEKTQAQGEGHEEHHQM